MAVKPIPDGYHSITPCLIVEGADKLLEFIENVFGGEIMLKMQSDEGKISHAEIKIGNSVVMVADAGEEWEAIRSWLYVYVEDTDAVYQKAVQAGAASVKEPEDQFYGDRSGGVRDVFGNYWGIATHIEDVSDAEIQKRIQAMHQTAG